MENLIAQFKGYASVQTQEGLRFLYEDIAEALADETFISILYGLGYDSILKEMERNLANSISDYALRPYINILREIHTRYSIRKLENKTGINSVRHEAYKLESQLKAAQDDVANIRKVSGVLSGAEMLAAYAEDFNKEAKEHGTRARNWLGWLVVAIIGWVVLASILLCVQLSDFTVLNQIIADDVRGGMEIPRIVALAIKGGILAVYTQIPLFLKKNYYAERHLEQANIHRRNVLKSLHAVYNTVNDDVEKNKLLVIGATAAFSEPESGFITRKEGAGSDNSSIESILKTFTK